MESWCIWPTAFLMFPSIPSIYLLVLFHNVAPATLRPFSQHHEEAYKKKPLFLEDRSVRTRAKMLIGSWSTVMPQAGCRWFRWEWETQTCVDIIYLVEFPVLGLHGGAALTCRGCRGISCCPVLPPSSWGGAMTVLPPRAAGKPGFALPLQPQPVIAREEGPPRIWNIAQGKSRSQPLWQASTHLQGFALSA